MRRTPLKRKTPLRAKKAWKPTPALMRRCGALERKSRLSPISARRRKFLTLYAIVRQTMLDVEMKCAICHEAKATEIHHRKGRDGARLIDTRYMLAVCRPCHYGIHENPAHALNMGWLLLRSDND